MVFEEKITKHCPECKSENIKLVNEHYVCFGCNGSKFQIAIHKRWVSVESLNKVVQDRVNFRWACEQLEKEVLKHNKSCNNIANIASHVRYISGILEDLT